MYTNIIIIIILVTYLNHVKSNERDNKVEGPTPCKCGVFLSGQISNSAKEEPKGNPALTTEVGTMFMNNQVGVQQCISKCLESIVKHLPKSADIICATLDRDCFKERALLFVQNHSTKWINSKMSAGREYCCKDNLSYKCPAK